MTDGLDELLKMLSDEIAKRSMSVDQNRGDLAKSGGSAEDIIKAEKANNAERRQLIQMERQLLAEKKAAARPAQQQKAQEAREARQDARNVRQNVREFAAADKRKAANTKRFLGEADLADAAATVGGVGSTRGAAARAKGLGRLPLASVPAALSGNRSAGARVGLALGHLAGMGMAGGLPGMAIGAAGAAVIGAGAAASPIGMGVITKPLEILSATIGIHVLPALTRFGAKILQLSDWVEENFPTKSKRQQREDNLGAMGGAARMHPIV